VSEKHANFIINYSNKDSQKILDLAKFIKDKVADHFDIMLEEEVVIY
jgi:UDP-N-acetylenolpyruvoylglucosamine reductase